VLVPFILRKIRKSKWYKHEGIPWLAEDGLQADALGDLQTSDNSLSVWKVKDDKSNLKRIITALAANGEHISNFDYALFDIQSLLQLNIQTGNLKGNTPDKEANVWHLDLIQLSAQNLMDLARKIMNAERERILEKDILRSIQKGVALGQIDITKLKSGVRAKIVL